MNDESGNRYLVSNNHVIGRSNDAQPGDPIVQPGTLDFTGTELTALPTLADLTQIIQIAELTASVPLRWRTSTNVPINTVDAAIGMLTNSGRGLIELERLCYAGNISGVAEPYELDPATGALQGSAQVYKVGRTTGFTEGVVTNVLGTTNIPYPGGVAYFNNQIIIQATPDNVGPFSDNGDSGSGVINDRHELVGLLFAGSALQPLVNPIDSVVPSLRSVTGIPSLQVIVS